MIICSDVLEIGASNRWFLRNLLFLPGRDRCVVRGPAKNETYPLSTQEAPDRNLAEVAQTLSSDIIDLAGGNVILLVGMGAIASFILWMEAEPSFRGGENTT